MRIHTKFNGYGPDGSRRYYKGGGGGDQVKYDNLERLYAEQAASARLLRGIAEKNLPGATQAYVGEVQNVLAPGYANRQAGLAGADMVSANTMERAATERNLASMGVNPNDPRFAGSMRGVQLNNAARLAAGKNIARNEADQFQLNVAKDAVGTFTGQSNNAATQMGNAASGLGSVYTSQANQKAMQDQQQSSAVGNAVAGGLMAYSMFKNGGKVKQLAAGGNVGQSYDQYAATQTMPSAEMGSYQGITPEQWDAAAQGFQASNADSTSTPSGFLAKLLSSKMRIAQASAPAADTEAGSVPNVLANKIKFARDGGPVGLKTLERHMLGGQAGSQQGNQGFFQMQQVAPPPSFQAPQQQQGSPVNMQTIQTAQKIKKGGGMQGAAQRTTDNLGRLAGKFSDAAGNQIQSHAAGMGMDAAQANAAADAYVQAAQSAADPALAQTYLDTASGITAGAGGELVSNAAMAGLQDAGLATAAGTVAEGAGAGAAIAAEGTGAALGSAAGALGTALPWVGAAFAIGSLFDWWNEGGKVGTQNKGMSEQEARRRFDQAAMSGSLNDLRAGGEVPGDWQENRDTVPALLVEEEHVLNAEASKLVGEKQLEKLNQKGLALRKKGKTPDTIKTVGLGALA